MTTLLLPTGKPHISYSELREFRECPFRHYLKYVQSKETDPNEHTALGSAVHSTCEIILLKEDVDHKDFFVKEFEGQIAELEKQKDSLDRSLLLKMKIDAPSVFEEVLPFLEQQFGEFEVVAIEDEIYEPIEELKDLGLVYFNGFIDLMIRTKDGKLHIIDWKTSRSGWHPKKKSDALTLYQIILYKEFYARSKNLDVNNIETHFIILKWGTKSQGKIENIEVSSKSKRTQNALKILFDSVRSINTGVKIRNRTSCQFCKYKDSDKC